METKEISSTSESKRPDPFGVFFAKYIRGRFGSGCKKTKKYV
jgi:hypothetical protein